MRTVGDLGQRQVRRPPRVLLVVHGIDLAGAGSSTVSRPSRSTCRQRSGRPAGRWRTRRCPCRPPHTGAPAASDPHRPVLASSGQPPAVRRPGDRHHGFGVGREHGRESVRSVVVGCRIPNLGVPDPDGAIARADRQQAADRRPGHRGHSAEIAAHHHRTRVGRPRSTPVPCRRRRPRPPGAVARPGHGRHPPRWPVSTVGARSVRSRSRSVPCRRRQRWPGAARPAPTPRTAPDPHDRSSRTVAAASAACGVPDPDDPVGAARRPAVARRAPRHHPDAGGGAGHLIARLIREVGVPQVHRTVLGAGGEPTTVR